MLVFILGGARSGKSRAAESLAQSGGRPVTYVATAVAADDEFRTRVTEHRRRRPPEWETVEEPVAVTAAVAARPGRTLIVDCLGFLVTNVLFDAAVDPESDSSTSDPSRAEAAERRALELVEELAAAAAGHDGLVIVVSNEVGQGVVPPYPAGRLFRDVLGRANQIMAAHAQQVLYMVAGIPVVLRGSPGGEGLER